MSILRCTPGAQWLASTLLLADCQRPHAVPAEPPPESVQVETIEVSQQPMPQALALTGTLRGRQQAELAANATGRVQKTFVERGTEVRQGDLLATLDVRSARFTATEAQANEALARAQAETAVRECARYQKLVEHGAVSPAEFDRMSDACRTSPFSVEAAQARSQVAAIAVGDGSIRAPFAGVITARYVEPGEYLHADNRVVSVVALDPLKLELTVPEANLAALKVGGGLSFTVPAYPTRHFSGTVRYVGAAVRETTRDLVAEAIVDNPDHALRPGMFATVSLFTGDATVPALPSSALINQDGIAHVFVVVNKRIEERVVQIGEARGDLVAMVRGVTPGDHVVNNPSPTLRNGQPTN